MGKPQKDTALVLLENRSLHFHTEAHDMIFIQRNLIIALEKNNIPLPIEIYKPVAEATSDFCCRFTIGWPSKTQTGDIYGIDSVQALTLALNIIASSLYQSEYHKDGRLVWEIAGDGYGFPLSTNVKDLAQGGDKLF